MHNPRIPKTLTAVDYAYLAGIVGGEGYIALHQPGRGHGRPRPQFEVSSTDPELIDWLKSTIGGWCPQPRPAHGNNKTEYRWRCSGKEAAYIAQYVSPYMRIERKRAKVEGFIGW